MKYYCYTTHSCTPRDMCGLNPKSHSGVKDTWPPGYCHLSAARSYESSTAVSSSSKTMNAPEAQATQKVTWLKTSITRIWATALDSRHSPRSDSQTNTITKLRKVCVATNRQGAKVRDLRLRISPTLDTTHGKKAEVTPLPRTHLSLKDLSFTVCKRLKCRMMHSLLSPPTD